MPGARAARPGRARASTAGSATFRGMRIMRLRSRLRPLDERECYLRLHGRRSGEVELVRRVEPRPPAEPPAAPEAREPRPAGPTETGPALHLVIPYPRAGGRLTGEQVRRELLRRMESHAGEAA